ncbi:hypothetical protein QUO16_004442 [Vibrio parahaemolyticus]|uniref:hypothetical protein n=1 Tax=Vibrio parahaemolyticus TaxID=670 RepID=UPI000A38D3E2|nr:hypothetical protein [Vibrio parahaemolyticus]ELA9373120.1 hypothetical protein [Vibrio parahaemolyticus]OUJ48310.1 hypothetical protein BTM22_24250 [Vibrio parahaemolyticus]TOE56043.1 restriction endonuclease [Vibrio parahaemolyticus]HCH3682898.1 hypothetical protein [Vibrio parahaemolyticus]
MNRIDIYDLSGSKFEELAKEFLHRQSDLSLIYSPENDYMDLGYDFKAIIKGHDGKQHTAAVELKHRKHFSKSDLKRLAHNAERIKNDFEGYILVTSAAISHEDMTFFMDLLNEIGFSLIRVYEKINIDKALDMQSSSMAQKIYKSKERERKSLVFAWLSIFITVLGLSISIYSYFTVPLIESTGLDSRIEKVEGALQSIKSLESYLSDIKSDMEQTHIQTKVIQEEYEKSQVLKELTESQLNAVRGALDQNRTSWWLKLFDYFLAFILGIAASVVASNIHERIKRNKELNSPV